MQHPQVASPGAHAAVSTFAAVLKLVQQTRGVGPPAAASFAAHPPATERHLGHHKPAGSQSDNVGRVRTILFAPLFSNLYMHVCNVPGCISGGVPRDAAPTTFGFAADMMVSKDGGVTILTQTLLTPSFSRAVRQRRKRGRRSRGPCRGRRCPTCAATLCSTSAINDALRCAA